jgi:hypothetical protein
VTILRGPVTSAHPLSFASLRSKPIHDYFAPVRSIDPHCYYNGDFFVAQSDKEALARRIVFNVQRACAIGFGTYLASCLPKYGKGR